MGYQLVLQAGVESDIEDAYNWYEDRQDGLGELFFEEIITCYHKLEQNPTAFSMINKYSRQAILNRFPYVIVFEVKGVDVVIYAVFHTSRDPKKKFKKG